MTRAAINNEYYQWLFNTVDDGKRPTSLSYDKLLRRLHNTDFRYSILRDGNRAEDGRDLRYRFAITQGYSDEYEIILKYLNRPCSVLEMMIALAVTCEEDIMDDTSYGNRTGQWFWGMIVNLGLGSMTDNRFDEQYVDSVVNRFLDRNYAPNGEGGLFTIRHCDRDLREVELWHQLCWYLDSIIDL